MKGASRVAIRTEEHKVSTSLSCTLQPSGSLGVIRTDSGLCAMTASVLCDPQLLGSRLHEPPASTADNMSQKISPESQSERFLCLNQDTGDSVL